jgi:hypothetical protein
LLEVPVALPASPDAADALSYWMKAAADLHGISYASVLATHEVPHRCAIHADIAVASNLKSLDLTNFAAPLMLTFFFMLLAVCTRITRKVARDGKVAQRASREMTRASMRASKNLGKVVGKVVGGVDDRGRGEAEPTQLRTSHSDSAPASTSTRIPGQGFDPSPVQAQPTLLLNDASKQDALAAIEENMRTISRQLRQLHEATTDQKLLA